MAGSVMGTSQSYNGDVQNNMGGNINPQLANYSMPQNQNGMPMFGGSNSAAPDWSQMQMFQGADRNQTRA
ncbi:hypothetical protein P8C59_001299 [Phyllachora maydis]|uniref:Uncharacterized protein n=1 Tax=Phyllachora maydis TaxID=1825666 RepID=A0AAD9HZ12_9PEZI|nr:hypothetical protein P8C59_001299 [Phyllachora maydis]